MERTNSFDVAYEQYQWLADKTQTTMDIQEKNLLLRRRINLLSVMEFILLETRRPN